jgi:hypothetical protein
METMDPTKAALNDRLQTIGWALFLIMAGGFWLVPDGQLPQGSWLVGLGIILLGLNVVRYRNGIRMSTFTTIIGAIALIAGVGDFAGIDVPVGPVLIILIGAAIILRNIEPRRAA